MKRIHEIGIYRAGDLRVEIVDLNELDEIVDGKTAVFVGHTTVTNRIGGEESSNSYQISREYSKQQSQWRLTKSERVPLVGRHAGFSNYARRAVA